MYKNNKMKCWKKKLAQVAPICVLSSAICVNPAFAETTFKSGEDIGKGAQQYTNYSTISDGLSNIKASLKVTFVDDPNYNKQVAIISTEGTNIDAGKEIINPNTYFADPSLSRPDKPAGYFYSFLRWPSQYNMSMKLKDNGSAQFFSSAPNNTIDAKTVSSSASYVVGGNINISKGEPASSGSASFSTSVSYNQPDYKTIQESNTAKDISWRVPFVSAMNQGHGPYTMNSSDSIYNNQLFMSDRNDHVNAKDNFISSDQMPALAAYNFTPGVIAVVIADKEENASKLNVTFGRHMTDYWLNWYAPLALTAPSPINADGTGFWQGGIRKVTDDGGTSQEENPSFSLDYTLDWKTHKLIDPTHK
ncbi:hemolysin II [Bacillus cereus]|nr:hemolysin II [Bacillus cereus]PGV93073.1 hemolysin II [Bacillus cereus]